MNTGKVYFVAAPARIKIGFTCSPERRLIALRRADMEELTVIAIIDGSRALEKHLHGLLKEHRFRGEWFRDCDDVRRVIDEAISGKHVVAVPAPEHQLSPAAPDTEPKISPEFEIVRRLSDEAEAALSRKDDEYEICGRIQAFLSASEVFIQQREELQGEADDMLAQIDRIRRLANPNRTLAGG
jgi:hypothetical protein